MFYLLLLWFLLLEEDKMSYSPTSDTQFFGGIEKRRAEIAGLNVPEEERKRLYGLVDETIKRYQELKVTTLNNQIGLSKLREAEVHHGEAAERLEGEVAQCTRELHILGNRVRRLKGKR